MSSPAAGESGEVNEVGAAAAFAAGIISFLSPCIFPLIPSYLSFIGGSHALRQDGKVVLSAVFFTVGFSLVFILLGAGIAAGSSLLTAYAPVYELISGIFIMLMGLQLVFGFIPLLLREARVHTRRSPAGPVGAVAVGMAFGAGWTPCVGPVLASILLLAGMEGNAVTGIVYLGLYALGLGIPFVLAGVFLERFARFQQLFRRHTRRIQIGSGVVLTLVGALIAAGRFQLFTAWLLNLGAGLAGWGENNPGAASAAAAVLMLIIGMVPLAVHTLRKKHVSAVWWVIAAGSMLAAFLEATGVLNVFILLGRYMQFQGM
ncbi:MAG: cytochrome c biogenesis CcdA family protein [Spirochaeta sp.]